MMSLRPLFAIGAWGLAAAALAQEHVAPLHHQSTAQQSVDEAECAAWATQKTGFDPSRPPPPAAQPNPRVTGSGARVAGAAGGAVVAGAAGGDAGTGALVGAAAGGILKRGANRREARRANEANAQHYQAGLTAYHQARAACLGGRGYSVK
jgi:hypothetical protein